MSTYDLTPKVPATYKSIPVLTPDQNKFEPPLQLQLQPQFQSQSQSQSLTLQKASYWRSMRIRMSDKSLESSIIRNIGDNH